jgi:hypothetical protein
MQPPNENFFIMNEERKKNNNIFSDDRQIESVLKTGLSSKHHLKQKLYLELSLYA